MDFKWIHAFIDLKNECRPLRAHNKTFEIPTHSRHSSDWSVHCHPLVCCNPEATLYSFFVCVKCIRPFWESLIHFLETHCCVCPWSGSLLCICAAMVSPVWIGHMIRRPLRAHYLTTATLLCNNTEIIYRTLTYILHSLLFKMRWK